MSVIRKRRLQASSYHTVYPLTELKDFLEALERTGVLGWTVVREGPSSWIVYITEPDPSSPVEQKTLSNELSNILARLEDRTKL